MSRGRTLWLGNEEVPTLGTFAARQLVHQFNHVHSVGWRSDVLAQNVRLRHRLSRMARNQDRVKALAVKRKYRIRDAVNELQYTSRKILEIADMLAPELPAESLNRRIHYAYAELNALHDLEFSIQLLQGFI